MQDKYSAIMEHGSQVEDPNVAEKIALEMSNKLIEEIKVGNSAKIKELITKDPENPNKYVAPVKKIHLAAARGVNGSEEPLTTANSILKLFGRYLPEKQIRFRCIAKKKPC